MSNKLNNKKLHIVFLDFDDIKNPLLASGQAKATYEVGRRLVKRGNKVNVITSRYPNCKDCIERGIEYKHVGLGSRFLRLNNLIYIFALPFAVRKIKADIIIECFTAPISTLFTPIFTRIPVIALPSMFNAKEFTIKYHLPFHWVERFGLSFYKYIMPYSDIDSGKASRINPDIIYRIIPQGVGKEFFEIATKPSKHILFLGRFDVWQKGIDLLLEAYAKVAKEIEYPLLLVGHGTDEKRIRKMVEDLSLKKKVRIIGPAYGKKKFDLMSEAIYVAFPSRHDELSLWALEALASGLPLVCFDLPECSWAKKSVALKAKSFDVDEYAKLLLKATDRKLIDSMRVASRKFARKYTWENVVNQFESFFTHVLYREGGKVSQIPGGESAYAR